MTADRTFSSTKRRKIRRATRDAIGGIPHSYGFAAFDVDPGGGGPTTAMHVTYYAVSGPCGGLLPVDRFTLTRSRRA